MPIIVDKKKKKRDIASACKDLLVARPVYDLTIAELAKAAGIGKGTFYEYFSNKEELLFTLVEMLMEEYNAHLETQLTQCDSIREKLKCFAEFFYVGEAEELRTIYKSFIGVTLLEHQEKLMTFQTECLDYYYRWFERLMQEGVESGELAPMSDRLAKGLFAMAKGIFVISQTTFAVDDVKREIDDFVDTLLTFVSMPKDT